MKKSGVRIGHSRACQKASPIRPNKADFDKKTGIRVNIP
jgi:hypothetical protein